MIDQGDPFLISGKDIVLINTPLTFTKDPLAPLYLIPVGILKIATYLKKRRNRIFFIDMSSRESYPFRLAPIGREGKRRLRVHVMGKTMEQLKKALKKRKRYPDEIWISCSFTSDHPIVESMVRVCRDIFPKVRIRWGGDSVQMAPELATKLGVEAYLGRCAAVDDEVPDFYSVPRWDYGLFQLGVGCVNRCSFCTNGRQRLHKLQIGRTLSYMKAFYDAFRPKVYYNWDPNILAFGDHINEFLKRFERSGIRARLLFGKGFQPNLLRRKTADLMGQIGNVHATLPVDSGDSRMARRLNKPYTVISSVKALKMVKDAGVDLKFCPATFVIGYPDDDLAAIFRIFLVILRFKGQPSPFPVFLFPGASDYGAYCSMVKHKDFSDLQGYLWPLVKSDDVPEYQSLLKFLCIDDLGVACKSLFLLTPGQREVFLEEWGHIDAFIEMCLNASQDTVRELERIESYLLKVV